MCVLNLLEYAQLVAVSAAGWGVGRDEGTELLLPALRPCSGRRLVSAFWVTVCHFLGLSSHRTVLLVLGSPLKMRSRVLLYFYFHLFLFFAMLLILFSCAVPYSP